MFQTDFLKKAHSKSVTDKTLGWLARFLTVFFSDFAKAELKTSLKFAGAAQDYLHERLNRKNFTQKLTGFLPRGKTQGPFCFCPSGLITVGGYGGSEGRLATGLAAALYFPFPFSKVSGATKTLKQNT